MSSITAIGTANPKYKFSQTQLASFMVKAMQLDSADARKLNAVFKASGIDHRYSVLEDYGLLEDFTFYPNTDNFEPFPTTSQRLKTFREYGLTLSVDAVNNLLEQVKGFDVKSLTHLIVVSCTGLYAPGLDIELVKALGLKTSILRTAINFMGCYAAFNALKVADAFCKEKDSKVLIVCTELCSLHFQKEFTEDNLLSNALFSDGAASVLVEQKSSLSRRLIPEAFFSDLITDEPAAMAWGIGDFGFEMKLSSYVPSIIKKGIAQLASTLLSGLGKNLSDINHFAIHPGGRKILENIEEALQLKHSDNAPAYHVLKNYGNMSSPTILFVMAEIMKDLDATNNDEHVLGFAFGPGLTLESMLLRIEIS
ncbi:MAG: type III polyketide synthase [Chryseolinea sp.]